MNSIQTARLSLPLLVAGQSHKEVFHNEALTLLDFLVHPVVVGVQNDPQILTPSDGQCWLIGASPLSDWTGKANQIACWTEGGWRYLEPVENMQLFVENDDRFSIYGNGSWVANNAIAPPSGGQTVDAEARSVIDSILGALQTLGITPA